MLSTDIFQADGHARAANIEGTIYYLERPHPVLKPRVFRKTRDTAEFWESAALPDFLSNGPDTRFYGYICIGEAVPACCTFDEGAA